MVKVVFITLKVDDTMFNTPNSIMTFYPYLDKIVIKKKLNGGALKWKLMNEVVSDDVDNYIMALNHETIHDVLYRLEGVETSIDFDNIDWATIVE